jgi:hypothetical protein
MRHPPPEIPRGASLYEDVTLLSIFCNGEEQSSGKNGENYVTIARPEVSMAAGP